MNYKLSINLKKIDLQKNIINFLHNTSSCNNLNLKTINVGDLIKIEYKISSEKTQIIEGIIIAKQNRNFGKSISLRRYINNIGIEHIIAINSPNIISISTIYSSKIRRSKLYFLRLISQKAKFFKKKILCN